MAKSYVYVLQCGSSKCYCGPTRVPIEERLQAHWLQTGYGSLSTAKNKPAKALSCVEVDGDPLPLARAQTAALMLEHGWQAVRGGPWCKPDMTKPPSCWDPEWRNLEAKYGPKRQASCPSLPSTGESGPADSHTP